MNEETIIEKAKQLGIDPGNVSQREKIHAIAEQLGVEDLDELNDTLDRMLTENEQSDNIENLDDVETLDSNVEYASNNSEGQEERPKRFGEEEYNAAKNEDGTYNKDYYKDKQKELDEKVEKAKEQKEKKTKDVETKNEKGEKVTGQKNKNIFDKAKDNRDLRQAKNERFMNKLNSAKAKAYNVTHPGEALKNKTKEVAKNTAKKAGKAAGKAAKKGAQAIANLIKKNPYVLIAIVGAAVILLIILLFAGNSGEESAVGYYDNSCNFNTTRLNLKTCNSSSTQSLTLKDYVLGATYSYIKDATYSDTTKTTLMIILKTNALSKGGYNNKNKVVTIDDCDTPFTMTSEIPAENLETLQAIYESIEEEIFVSESYQETITSLSIANSLKLNNEILNEIESLSKNYGYSTILDKIYNTEVSSTPTHNSNRKSVFLGDSRIRGMENFGILTNSNNVSAEGAGWEWFNGSESAPNNKHNCNINPVNCINEKIGNEPTNIITWLGVNDLDEYESFYNKYYELATKEWSNHYIYVVSVGYVDDSKSQWAKNEDIIKFNNYMKKQINESGLHNLIYVDLGMNVEIFKSGSEDGIHYNSNLSKLIYNTILQKTNNNSPSEGKYRETIFIGDSRTQMMKAEYGILTNENSVYAGGEGYEWFSGNEPTSFINNTYTYNCTRNAIKCVNDKIGNTPSNIVTWLGVNDLGNVEKYFNKYYELATKEWSNHYLYVVSVGQADDNKLTNPINDRILEFNEIMKQKINDSGLYNLIYIDLGIDLETTKKGSGDGIHYYKDYSQLVYDTILEKIGSSTTVSVKKRIYSIGNNCTYYTFTANDAYWWPIGSPNETDDDIYGGVPSSTLISSPFGTRIHPVHGTRSHHAGIDIAAGAQENVIATKPGTVITAIDICTETEEGEGCNGGAGNMVEIDHGNGVISRYLHMYPGSIVVNVGDEVRQGQKIGGIGTTGTSTGNHLHFEIRINGMAVNPTEYVDDKNPRPITKFITPDNIDEGVTDPKEVKSAMCQFFLDSGISVNGVTGIMVNVGGESSYKLNNLEGCYETGQCCPHVRQNYGNCGKPQYDSEIYANDKNYTEAVDNGTLTRDEFINDSAGYGLVQWTSSGRKARFYDYTKSQGKSISSISAQMGYILIELEEDDDYKESYKYVTGNYSANEIATVFCLNYERPSGDCKERANKRTPEMLQYVQNGCSEES